MRAFNLLFLFNAVLLMTLFSLPVSATQRFISLAPHITELMYAIGAEAQLVAVSDYSDYPEAAKQLPRVASHASVNIEAVLALQPAVVIAWRSGSPSADLSRLQQLGVKVVYSDPLTLDDIATELEQLGRLTGRQQQAAAQADAFRQALNLLRQQYQQQTKIKVFYAMSTAPLSTVANNAWPSQMLTLCGAENTFANAKTDYPQVGLEQVLARQPEVIIQAAGSGRAADFSFWQAYKVLPAVALQQFLTVNADYVYRTTPRTIEGIRQLCEGLAPFRQG
ncbi:cobalamin-binding protein [Arsukibacterium sp.]|uniref:cobalamin-binding protein n=1 Tax=Arsukibacterium sp. TaxID=1977258 RepID=UPI002FDA429A